MSKFSAILLATLIGALYWLIKPPPFTKPLGSSYRATCIGNMTQLASAKEQWAMDQHKKDGTQPNWSDVIGPYIKTKSSCPDGGVYVLGQVGNNPRCSHSTGDAPHVMP